ncbi:MAG: DUF305 domain-containing protein [Candidatus Saccharimonadales bacterium]
METKSLLTGLAGFFIGGLLVATAATVMNQPKKDTNAEMSMTQMTDSLKDKTGDEFDKAFVENMISHHQSAVDMARLSATNAKHDEIKKLSTEIISAQDKEIAQMKLWQENWGYTSTSSTMNHSSH